MDATAGRRARLTRVLLAVAGVAAIVALGVWALTGRGTGDLGGVPTASPTAEGPTASAAPTEPGEETAGVPQASDPSDPPPDLEAQPVPGSPELPPDKAAGVAAIFGNRPYSLPTSPMTAPAGEGLVAEVQDVALVDAQVEGPGQVAGEALLISLVVTNSGGSPFDLGGSSVTAYEDDGIVPVSLLDSDPRYEPLSGELPPGGAVSASLVFARPGPDGLTLAVLLGADTPVAIFEGLLPADG